MGRIPTPLRKLTLGKDQVSAVGATVGGQVALANAEAPLTHGKYYLTFPPNLEQQSVICDMYDRLGVRFSIRQAQVGDDVAILGVELMGAADRVRGAVEYLAARGVRVEPVHIAPAE